MAERYHNQQLAINTFNYLSGFSTHVDVFMRVATILFEQTIEDQRVTSILICKFHAYCKVLFSRYSTTKKISLDVSTGRLT